MENAIENPESKRTIGIWVFAVWHLYELFAGVISQNSNVVSRTWYEQVMVIVALVLLLASVILAMMRRRFVIATYAAYGGLVLLVGLIGWVRNNRFPSDSQGGFFFAIFVTVMFLIYLIKLVRQGVLR